MSSKQYCATLERFVVAGQALLHRDGSALPDALQELLTRPPPTCQVLVASS